MRAERLAELAQSCGFEIAGAAPALPLAEAGWYHAWTAAGLAGEMRYLTGRRAQVRDDPRNLMPSARSVICAGKLYNGPCPHSTAFTGGELAWISRYAWGDDYHDVMRRGMAALTARLREERGGAFEYRILVDTAPLLERAYARRAGLGWIGRNTCLIHERMGSWFFLAGMLVSFDLEHGRPPPDRCGTCTRCIEACPTRAIVPVEGPQGPAYTLDARRCISYLTIELRGPVPPELRAGVGANVFGCDICQDVCPWNSRAPLAADPAFSARNFAPPLERLASLSVEEFGAMFHGTPVERARYAGFLRNVAVAMGNAGLPKYRPALARLAASPDPLISGHARWALARLGE